jgi:hypothetical protein
MRAFLMTLPSGARYWTVVDDELAVVPDADAHLGHLRFGRDASELTTKSYAGGASLCSSAGTCAPAVRGRSAWDTWAVYDLAGP